MTHITTYDFRESFYDTGGCLAWQESWGDPAAGWEHEPDLMDMRFEPLKDRPFEIKSFYGEHQGLPVQE